MKEGPSIAAVAALIGDPARANMLTALMDGRALTVSELGEAAGVALPTASEHLARLATAGLVVAEKQGRHRYHRLSAPEVAAALESLMSLAERTGATRVRTGPRDAALREARVCYDHLAGARAVLLAERWAAQGLVELGESPRLSESGVAELARIGVRIEPKSRRPLCRTCLDWSERRPHLAGRVGAAILDHLLKSGWATRKDGRALSFTPAGAAAFDIAYGLYR